MKRVLVVEDHIDAAQSLAQLLRALGHEAFVAHDGRTALDILSAARPDVALLDITLPDMSGYDLARQVRVRVQRSVRIVALTGFGLEEDRERAREAGFDHFVLKPVDMAYLKSLLAG